MFALDPSFIGIPYVDRGRDPAAGLDCWGLACLVYRRLKGVELPSLLERYTSARDHASVTALVGVVSGEWLQVPKPEPLDLVTLTVAGRPWHVGVTLDDRHFLHTMEGLGSIIDRLDSPRWAPRVDAYWSYAK